MSLKGEIDVSIKLLNIIDDACSKSTIFSPASILNSFAIIYAGTDGATAEELAKVIGGENMNEKEIIRHYSSFVKNCQDSNKSMTHKLLFSNKLFLSNVTLLPSFTKTMNDMFNNQIQQVDFSNKNETIEVINKFVSENTEGLIKEIVTERDVNDSINIFIVNALCFIAEWEEKFKAPTIGNFYSNSSSREIQMLKKEAIKERLNLTKGDNWTCLGIPYKTRKSWLHIILPNNIDGLPEILKTLDFTIIQKCVANNLANFVNVTIPAFEINEEIELTEKMKALGLTDLFNGGHGITKMFEQRQFVDAAIHKAGIKVDENGTFGYAAAAIRAKPQAAYQFETFNADHPFIYFVTLTEDGNCQNLKSILLSGTFC